MQVLSDGRLRRSYAKHQEFNVIMAALRVPAVPDEFGRARSPKTPKLSACDACYAGVIAEKQRKPPPAVRWPDLPQARRKPLFRPETAPDSGLARNRQ